MFDHVFDPLKIKNFISYFKGMGEVFVTAGVFDYTYAKCPPQLRSTSIG